MPLSSHPDADNARRTQETYAQKMFERLFGPRVGPQVHRVYCHWLSAHVGYQLIRAFANRDLDLGDEQVRVHLLDVLTRDTIMRIARLTDPPTQAKTLTIQHLPKWSRSLQAPNPKVTTELERLCQDLAEDEATKEIRTVRDKRLAHWDHAPGSQLPTVNHETCKAVLDRVHAMFEVIWQHDGKGLMNEVWGGGEYGVGGLPGNIKALKDAVATFGELLGLEGSDSANRFHCRG